jgi:O-antigen/teichoic acid export membrane protein
VYTVSVKKPLSIRKYFAYGILAGGAVFVLTKIAAFVLKIIIAKLGVSQFGSYYIFTTLFSNITMLVALGIPMSLTRFISLYIGMGKRAKRTEVTHSALSFLIATGVISTIVLYTGSPFFSHIMHSEKGQSYVSVLALGIIAALLIQFAKSIYLGYLRPHVQYGIDAIVIGLQSISIIYALWVLRLDVFGAIAAYVIGTCIGAAITLFFTYRFIDLKTFRFHITRELLVYTLPVSASEIFTALSSIIFIVLLKHFGGEKEVGLYAAAVSLASILHVIPQIILPMFLPIISNLYGKGQSIISVYTKILTILSFFTLAVLGLLIIGKIYIIQLLFGFSYQSSAEILLPLSIAYGWYAIVVWPNRQLLDMAGFTKYNFSLTLIRIFITSAILLLFIPILRGPHLALSLLAGWIGEGIVCLYILHMKGIFKSKNP